MDDDENKNGNLFILNGDGIPDKTRESLEQFRESFDILVEYIQLNARLHRVKYEALMKEGFSAIEALELCKKIF